MSLALALSINNKQLILLLLLRDIHSKFLSDCNFKEVSSQSEVNVGGSGGLRSQDGVSHEEETVPLFIPEVGHPTDTQSLEDLP